MTLDRASKTIIVGSGFSCVPLLRELDRTGEEYLIISEKIPNPIWANLKRNKRLDFDLVSSYYTSFYSFDLVKDFKSDMYTTAGEFHEMHLSYHEKYKDKILWDEVVKIENRDDHSVVHTKSGGAHKAANVVVSTGFRRNIHDSLNHFDYGTTGKTIVFNTVGDSSNLMIAKLVAQKNKIICLSNGFVALDKMSVAGKKTVTLDQIEFHNIGFLFPRTYRALIGGSSVLPFVMMSLSFKHTRIGRAVYRFFLGLGRMMSPYLFSFAYPETLRALKVDLKRMRKAMPFPNGIIAIKYWPIDSYAKVFGDKLEDAIKAGYLLNDLPLFIDAGLVEYWNKSDTSIDTEQKKIKSRSNDREVKYDHFVDGGPENPRLPPIVVNRASVADADRSYKYVYRENYLGVVPKRLSNIFFIGYTRPTTGGLANMTEMQGLFVHKLISNESFKNQICGSLDARLEKYNDRYYYSDEKTPTDHLVYYGFYTEEVARAIGISMKLTGCRSLRDLSKFLLFPNNAFKYRQHGEYKVDGCDKLVDHIDRAHYGWSGLKLRLLTFGLYHVMIFTALLLSYLRGAINLPVFIGAVVVQSLLNFIVVTPMAYAQSFATIVPYSYVRFAYLLLGLAAIVILGPVWFFPIIGVDFLWSYLVRKFKPEVARHIFNDLKVKRKYKSFLTKYLETYRTVIAVMK